MLQFFIISALVACAWGQVSQQEFTEGVRRNGFPAPSRAQYDNFMTSLRKGNIRSKMEAGMFLAQALHESNGLRDKSEIRCTRGGERCDEYQSGDWNPDCPRARPGKRFYGRGYLQLTYCSNYRAASRDLGYGERLADNPDSVAQQENLAWEVSSWYWKVNVQAKPEYKNNPTAFGLTTKFINGQREECQGNGKNKDKSQRRFQYYSTIFNVFKLSGRPNEAGCNY